MRFAGSYYLVVHLAAQVADGFGEGPFGLTLRVRVAGTARSGPAYTGRPTPSDVFTVPAGAPAERPTRPATTAVRAARWVPGEAAAAARAEAGP